MLFLYREVLGIDLPWMDGINRPANKRRIPGVLTLDEVAGVLAQMEGETALLARLLYGTGMRLMEGIRLRVKDVDFARHVIIVRQAKGNKDRVVMLPRSLAPAMRQHMLASRAVWETDRQAQRIPLAFSRSTPRRGAAPSPLPRTITRRHEKSRRAGGHSQAGAGPHVKPQRISTCGLPRRCG